VITSKVDTWLCIWSALADLWWVVAVALVALRFRDRSRAAPERGSVGSLGFGRGLGTAWGGRLTVFKPMPPLGGRLPAVLLERAVESFVRQLDEDSELLMGTTPADAPHWERVAARWRGAFPRATIRLCVREAPRHRANPKIAWLECLAPLATGSLWLWSDADIVAPAGLLDGLRRELERLVESGRGRAVTTPYCIRDAGSHAGLLDTAYVNAEFLPGALLLGRLGRVGFAFGAATLFRSEDLRGQGEARAWEVLGDSLADDYVLGRLLAPVLISRWTLETYALRGTWLDAVRHLHRWQRTIRWCRPGSFAALLLVHPLAGWALRIGWDPTNRAVWMGAGVQWMVEMVMVVVLLRAVGVQASWGHTIALAAWPGARLVSWVAAWLPIPVVWSEGEAPWSRPVQARMSGERARP
jgi:ceramide glucosyltransferase